MENVAQMEAQDARPPAGAGAQALELVKSEARPDHEPPGGEGGPGSAGVAGPTPGDEQQGAGGRDSSPPAHSQSVITSRRAVRTITAAGHITTDEPAELPDEGVKDEPPEAPAGALDEAQLQVQHYAAKLEEAEAREQQHYDDERLRLAEAETSRYLAFKPEPYRALPSPDKRAPPQYTRPPPRAAYPRGLALRYGAPHHVIVAQDGEPDDAHDAFLHKDKEQMQAYASGGGGEAAPGDARQYATVLGDQAASSLEMIQTTALNNQQAVGVAYQQVKYEARGEGEPRPSTYASLQPVTSVHGGYAYAGQSPQYAGGGYGAYPGGSKELLTLYGGGGGATGAAGGAGARGDESPPGQLLYRSDPTLSSSSLARGAHVVYGSVVPQSQAVYETPPSPNSQQVSFHPPR